MACYGNGVELVESGNLLNDKGKFIQNGEIVWFGYFGGFYWKFIWVADTTSWGCGVYHLVGEWGGERNWLINLLALSLQFFKYIFSKSHSIQFFNKII